MPTISIFKDDFESLLGGKAARGVSIEQVEEWLMLVKGELKGHNPETGEGEIIAASRLSKLHDPTIADFTCLISDAWQGQGLGTEILTRQLDIARAEGIRHIRGAILPEADNMKHIFQKFGFEIHQVPDSQAIRAEIDL